MTMQGISHDHSSTGFIIAILSFDVFDQIRKFLMSIYINLNLYPPMKTQTVWWWVCLYLRRVTSRLAEKTTEVLWCDVGVICVHASVFFLEHSYIEIFLFRTSVNSTKLTVNLFPASSHIYVVVKGQTKEIK